MLQFPFTVLFRRKPWKICPCLLDWHIFAGIYYLCPISSKSGEFLFLHCNVNFVFVYVTSYSLLRKKFFATSCVCASCPMSTLLLTSPFYCLPSSSWGLPSPSGVCHLSLLSVCLSSSLIPFNPISGPCKSHFWSLSVLLPIAASPTSRLYVVSFSIKDDTRCMVWIGNHILIFIVIFFSLWSLCTCFLVDCGHQQHRFWCARNNHKAFDRVRYLWQRSHGDAV